MFHGCSKATVTLDSGGEEDVVEGEAPRGDRSAVGVVAELQVAQEFTVGSGVQDLDALGLAAGQRPVDHLRDDQVGVWGRRRKTKRRRQCEYHGFSNFGLLVYGKS